MNKKGFTLIELLVYIGVSTVFLLALSGFVFSLFATYRQARVQSQQQREISNISARLQFEINSSYAIDPASVLHTDLSSNPSANVTLRTQNSNTDPLVFSVSNHQLLLAKGSSAPLPIHGSIIDIDSCVFSDQSTDISDHIQVTLTISTPVGFGIPDAQTQLSLNFELQDYAP